MAVKGNFMGLNASDSSEDNTKTVSPLTPLRRTSAGRVVVPSQVKKEHSKHRRKMLRDSGAKQKDPGFGFDIALPSPGDARLASADGDADESLDKAQKFAMLLLDSGKMINAKFNVVDKLGASDATPAGSDLHISRAARNRTDTTKAMLALKYHCLERAIQPPELETNPHPGVEGVYNPLQILRNRQVRAAHHEQAPQGFRGVPLACNVFSNRSRPSGKPWRMFWGIELSEEVSDLTWRNSHWHELRDPHGHLRFPSESKSSSSTSVDETRGADVAKPDKRRRSRMHDALFARDEAQASLDDVGVNLVPIEAARLGRRSKKGRKRIPGRFYSSSTGGALTSGSETELTENNRAKSYESLSKVKIGRVMRSNSPTDSAGELEGQMAGSPGDSAENMDAANLGDVSATPVAPIILLNDGVVSIPQSPVPNQDVHVFNNINDNGEDDELDTEDGPPEISPKKLLDVLFSPLQVRSLEVDQDAKPEVAEIEHVASIGSEAGPLATDMLAHKIDAIGQKQAYLDRILFLNFNYLANVCPESMENINKGGEQLLSENFSPLIRDIININDSYLPTYENFYTAFLNEAKLLMHVANDNYAVQIDNLLSATDRSNGEINTSLSMDLRKVNEQLDKLGNSLFGTKVIDKLKSNEVTSFNAGASHKTLYFVLENTIVILLRVIWILANIYKCIAFIFKLAWRVVSLMF